MTIDLLVIGGGINGAGIAADAAGRGLKVVLVEANDLASATSSASSKLIHGGLRYLEQYEFGLVKESLTERDLLIKNAPHLVTPQAFIIPHLSSSRPYWLVKIGMWLYDFLGGKKSTPKSKSMKLTSIKNLGLKKKFNRGFCYYDCTVDDSRLVTHVALQAKTKGAYILLQTKCLNAELNNGVYDVTLLNHKTNEKFDLQVKSIINATGPWADKVATEVLHIKPKYNIKLVKGSHLIVPKLFDHNYGLLLQNDDKRVVFVIPYMEKFHLIGTTDVVIDEIDNNIKVNQEEIDYLLNCVNKHIEKQIKSEDIIHQYWGIRPLVDGEDSDNASEVSREYLFDLNNDNKNNPIISVFGGKVTTYRILAEKAVDLLLENLDRADKPKTWTRDAKLPGGEIEQDLSKFKQKLCEKYAFLPDELASHYVKNYGARAYNLLGEADEISSLGMKFSELLYQKEVDFLIKEEWVREPYDLLWRRGKLGLFLNHIEREKLRSYMSRTI